MNKLPRCAKTLLKILFTRMNPRDSNPGEVKRTIVQRSDGGKRSTVRILPSK
jgi:hypothetical protein